MAKNKWDYNWKSKKDNVLEKRMARSVYFSQLAQTPGEPIDKILRLMESAPERFSEEVEHIRGLYCSYYTVADLINGFKFEVTLRSHTFKDPDGETDYFHTANARAVSIAWATPAELLQLALGAHKMISRKNNEKSILAAAKREKEIADGRRKTIELYNNEEAK